MQAYKEIYKVSDVYSEDEQRRIVGIRYAAEASGLSQTTLFTVADDISVDAVTQIKERQDEFKGIAVINDYIRQYDAPGLATHILGRTGKINAEEYEANKDLGYGYNDIIGKQGIEKWGEQYLRGIDGTTGTTKEVNGKEITVMNDAEPVPGDYIVLTLDSDLQKVAEKSLEDTIQNVYDTQKDVEQKQYLLATGQLEDAHSLPIAQAKAELSLEVMISLRNKAMEAYNEILKMSV